MGSDEELLSSIDNVLHGNGLEQGASLDVTTGMIRDSANATLAFFDGDLSYARHVLASSPTPLTSFIWNEKLFVPSISEPAISAMSSMPCLALHPHSYSFLQHVKKLVTPFGARHFSYVEHALAQTNPPSCLLSARSHTTGLQSPPRQRNLPQHSQARRCFC